MSRKNIQNKEIKQLCRKAIRAGATISFTRGNHIRVEGPLGKTVISSSTKLSGHQLRRMKQQIRSVGIEIS